MKQRPILLHQISFFIFAILFSLFFFNNNVTGEGVSKAAQKKREKLFVNMAKTSGMEMEADFLKELENFDDGIQEMMEFVEKQEPLEKIKKDTGGKSNSSSKKVGVGARLRQAFSAIKKLLTGHVNITESLKATKQMRIKKDKTIKKFVRERCNSNKGTEIENRKATLFENMTKNPTKFIKSCTKLLFCNIRGNCKPEHKAETCAMVAMVRSREYAEIIEKAEEEYHIKGFIANYYKSLMYNILNNL